MTLRLRNTSLCKPLSTRHTHINPNPNPYRTYHPQQIPAQQRPHVEVARLYGDLDTRHKPPCTRVNNPTLRPTALSTLLSLSLWNNATEHTETRATNPLLALRPCLLPLSLLPQDSLVSLVLNQVCQVTLFSFALRVFSMKWYIRLGFLVRAVFVLPRFLWTPPPVGFAPPFSKRISRSFPCGSSRKSHIFRVVWYVGSKFSISITFDIGYECLLIRYNSKNLRDSILMFAFEYKFIFQLLLLFGLVFVSLIASNGSLKSNSLLEYSPSSVLAANISLVGCLCK